MDKQIKNQYAYCIVGEATDVGQHRSANEDSCRNGVTINGLVATVCDGMGGHVGGATASKIAVDTIFEVLDNRFFDDPREAIGIAIDQANNAILQYSASHPELKGMGSTCVLLIVRDAKVYIGHVGDSRIYLVRKHTIKQLTTDHSYVQMLVDSGSLKPHEAERHPRKNEITNALGMPSMQPATIKPDPINPEIGDCFLLCSDGLTGMVADDKIERVVSNQRNLHLQDRANKLVMIANEAGGVDNISVELVEFADIPGAKRKISSRKVKILAIASGVALSILAIFAMLHFFRKDKPIDDTSTNTDITSPNDSIVETLPPLVEASTTNVDSDFIREESIDLGPIEVSKNEPFLTIRFKSDGSTIESTTTHVKIDKDLVSNPDIIDIKDDRLIKEIAHEGNDSILKIKIRNAPKNPQSFSIVIPDKNGKYKLTLKFKLSLKTTPPPKKPTEKKTPADSTQTPQVEQPVKTIPADSTTHSNKEEPAGKNTLNCN